MPDSDESEDQNKSINSLLSDRERNLVAAVDAVIVALDGCHSIDLANLNDHLYDALEALRKLRRPNSD
jgi:RNase P protein component